MKGFRLHYHVQSNGDGSVSVHFHSSKEDAEKAEGQDLKDYGEGWGEPSVGHVDLLLDDGQIMRLESEYDDETGKFKNVKLPLEAQKKG